MPRYRTFMIDIVALVFPIRTKLEEVFLRCMVEMLK